MVNAEFGLSLRCQNFHCQKSLPFSYQDLGPFPPGPRTFVETVSEEELHSFGFVNVIFCVWVFFLIFFSSLPIGAQNNFL